MGLPCWFRVLFFFCVGLLASPLPFSESRAKLAVVWWWSVRGVSWTDVPLSLPPLLLFPLSPGQTNQSAGSVVAAIFVIDHISFHFPDKGDGGIADLFCYSPALLWAVVFFFFNHRSFLFLVCLVGTNHRF